MCHITEIEWMKHWGESYNRNRMDETREKTERKKRREKNRMKNDNDDAYKDEYWIVISKSGNRKR